MSLIKCPCLFGLLQCLLAWKGSFGTVCLNTDAPATTFITNRVRASIEQRAIAVRDDDCTMITMRIVWLRSPTAFVCRSLCATITGCSLVDSSE